MLARYQKIGFILEIILHFFSLAKNYFYSAILSVDKLNKIVDLQTDQLVTLSIGELEDKVDILIN